MCGIQHTFSDIADIGHTFKRIAATEDTSRHIAGIGHTRSHIAGRASDHPEGHIRNFFQYHAGTQGRPRGAGECAAGASAVAGPRARMHRSPKWQPGLRGLLWAQPRGAAHPPGRGAHPRSTGEYAGMGEYADTGHTHHSGVALDHPGGAGPGPRVPGPPPGRNRRAQARAPMWLRGMRIRKSFAR